MKKKTFLLAIFIFIFCVTYAQTRKEYDLGMTHYADEDYGRSFKEFQKMAQYGNASMEFMLAEHYHYGQGTECNIDKAIQYYKAASDKGDDLAQRTLVDLLYENIDKLDSKGLSDLYKYSIMYCTNIGSDDDYCSVPYYLYLCYKNGWGTAANNELAETWLYYAGGIYQQSDALEEIQYKLNDQIDEIEDGTEAEEHFLVQLCLKKLSEKIMIISKLDFEKKFYSQWELLMIRLFYYSQRDDYQKTYSLFNELLENPETSDKCKSFFLSAIIEEIKNANLQNEELQKLAKFIEEYEELNYISEGEELECAHNILAMIMLKLDLIINRNKSVNSGCYNGHEWIDLGLPSGKKWATYNLGASKISDNGDRYAWGEIQQKRTFDEKNYTLYDSIFTLSQENDAANCNWGGIWSVPSIYDWIELLNYCEIKIDGKNFNMILKGPNGMTIELPYGNYWSNTKIHPYVTDETNAKFAYAIRLNDHYYVETWKPGFIRPVLSNY